MSTTLPRNTHIVSLDLLRGVAALSVCFFHIFSRDTFNHIPVLKAIFEKGYLGLDLFFIISGFIIPYSMYLNQYSIKKFPRYMLKRSCRIEPPYIISFILIILMKFIHLGLYGQLYVIDWKQFFLHFLYLNKYFGKESYSAVYWTLAIEFQFYILIGLIFPLILSKLKYLPIFLFLIWVSICWVVVLPYDLIFEYGSLFLAGILIFLYKINHITLRTFIPFLFATLLLMYYKNGLDVVLTTLFAATTIFMLNRRWIVTDFLGTISFSLYLVHSETSGFLDIYIRNYIPNQVLLKTITLLFAIAFATGFYYLIERPALNFSKKISYRDKKIPS